MAVFQFSALNDGQSIAFFSNADSSLKRIPVAGGQPQIIARDVTSTGGMSWGAGNFLVRTRGQSLPAMMRLAR